MRPFSSLSSHPDHDEGEARIGNRLGNFVLTEIIGRGGMGVVYRAEHVYLHKPAAIKVLHRRYFGNEEARHRFLREGQTASVIDHPNIVNVTDFGEAPDGTVFLVMSHIEGVGLDRVLRDEGSLPLFRTLGILNQVTRALGAAHERGVVHRDMKPENIMLADRPGRREIVRRVNDAQGGHVELIEMEDAYDFVTILDFGAAKFWHQSTAPLGENATVIGTPAYMAPETARNGVADARSDIYSIGVIMYEMLTGTVPFDGDDAVQIMIKHVKEPLDPPSSRNQSVEITPEAERVVLRALEKDPAQRYQTMAELNTDLQMCYGSVRFRRQHVAPPADGSFESLRRPVALTPDKVKRRNTPDERAPVATASVPVAPVQEKTGSGPVVLLTKRKSGRHGTMPYMPAVPEAAPDDPVAPTGTDEDE